MKASHRNERSSAAASLLRLAIAAFSLYQAGRSRTAARPLHSSFAPTTGERRYVRIPEGEEAPATADAQAAQPTAAKAAAQSSDLKSESYPKALFHIAITAAKAWSTRRAASKGAALALYTLFSMAPMLVLVVSIAGFFFGQENVRQSLVDQMSGLMGPQGAAAIETMLAGSRGEGGGLTASIVSAVLVLVSATTAFAELKESLDELWEVPPSQKSGLWHMVRERFLSFGLILVLALMLLASLSINAALASLGNLWGGVGEGSPLRIVTLAISSAVSFAIVTGLFAVIFKYLPAVKIAWKDVFIGAVITAALFAIGKTLINLYVAHGDVTTGYGAAGSVVILITWIFYSAQIFFYGALFTHAYAFGLGSRSPGAGGGKAVRRAPPVGPHGGAVGAHG